MSGGDRLGDSRGVSVDSTGLRAGSGSKFVNGGVLLLLVVHFGLANLANWGKSGTFDELAHVAIGYSGWATGDHRMKPVAVLQHRWISLPLYLGNYESPVPEGEMWNYADNWGYGRKLMFEPVDRERPELGLKNDPQEILHTARIMSSIWSVICAWVVFIWARRLWGTVGGFVSLALYVFNPNILAHAGLATIDLPAALAFTAGMYTLWDLLQKVTTRGLVISSIVWGLALASKFSALLLVPMGLGLMLLRLADGRPLSVDLPRFRKEVTTRGGLIPVFGIILVSHFLATYITIWALFGFRFSTFSGDPAMLPIQYTDVDGVAKVNFVTQFEHYANQPAVKESALLPVIQMFHSLRLFPEAYLTCFLDTIGTVSGFNSFLNGRFGIQGFPSFFPYCVLFKTPFSVFVIGALAVAAHAIRRFHQVKRLGRTASSLFLTGFYATAPLWTIIGLYWFTALTGHINIGIRHILPTFPAIFILMGAAGAWLGGLGSWFGRDVDSELIRTDDGPEQGEPFRSVVPAPVRLLAKWSMAICLGWFVLDVTGSYPNYLAYFNFIGGGTNGGYHHLVDSSYDWGQELPELARWMQSHDLHDPATRKRRVYLSYFGSTPPSAYGVHATLLPGFFDRDTIEPSYREPVELRLQPGVYIISATMLQSVYSGPATGPWRQDYEQNYRHLQNVIESLFSLPLPEQAQQIERHGGQSIVQNAMRHYEFLRLSRLCAYLRRHQPDDQINGGLLVYSLTQPELNAALYNNDVPPDTYPPPLRPEDNVPY